MYFDRNISENKDGKKNEGSYLSCVTNGEFYFSKQQKLKLFQKQFRQIEVLYQQGIVKKTFASIEEQETF